MFANLKLYLLIAAAVALMAALAHDHLLSQRLKVKTAALVTATATITAEREGRRKADEAAKRYETRNGVLEQERRDKPLPAVVVGGVCHKARSVPAAADPASAHEAAQGHDAGENAEDSDASGTSGGVDIGPALDDFATDAEANLIQCQELQRLVLGR